MPFRSSYQCSSNSHIESTKKTLFSKGVHQNRQYRNCKRVTCIAMTSGSKLVTNLVNSGQLFLTRRRKLLAFQVMNFDGSPLFSFDKETSSSFSGCEREGFFEDPSFSTGLKKRFMAQCLSLSTLSSALSAFQYKYWGFCNAARCSPASTFFFFLLISTFFVFFGNFNVIFFFFSGCLRKFRRVV